ncbi:hypothetical protein Btru_041332 [Bulinus truncatus]|nr:hypothetical protein Btru_041332 [Bulinus truncatus]
MVGLNSIMYIDLLHRTAGGKQIRILTSLQINTGQYNKHNMTTVCVMLVFILLNTLASDTESAHQLLLRAVKRSAMTSSFSDAGLLPDRVKRWDYTDGCHCNGFRIECPGDLFCQFKNQSRDWVCEIYCCGRRCVRKVHGRK